MTLSRLDLDGLGSPKALAERIHEIAADLPLDFDIADLCAKLDILAIKEIDTSSFEAALLMDEHKANGSILLAKGRRPERCRFSIGHELGHFLIPTHMPRPGEPMSCSLADLHHTDTSTRDRHKRVEAEAMRWSCCASKGTISNPSQARLLTLRVACFVSSELPVRWRNFPCSAAKDSLFAIIEFPVPCVGNSGHDWRNSAGLKASPGDIGGPKL